LPTATTASATVPMPEGPARQPAETSSNDQNSSANDITPPTDGLKNAVLGQLWLQIDEEIANSGASTYGVISKVINSNKKNFPWLNRNMVNYYRTKATKELSLPPQEIGEQFEAAVSGVTSESAERNSVNHSNNQSDRCKGGRPMGTTLEEKENLNKRKKLALNHAATKCKELKELDQESKRMKWGGYDKIIAETNAIFDLHTPDKINKETVRTRLKKNRKVLVAHRGTPSPMIRVEFCLVEIILSLSAMRQPVTPLVALELINSLVKGTATEQEILDYKLKNLKLKDPEENGRLLGLKYWHNFLKRNPILSTKKAVRFDSQRDDWCTLENFSFMYKEIYAKMVESRVAIELDKEQWVSKEGIIVHSEEEAFGRKTKYLVTRPEYIVFVDETGDNTSQKNDGNVNGTRYVCDRDERCLQTSSFKDRHFTSLGFTLADGRPLLCAIIIACGAIDAKTKMGLQPWCPIVGDGRLEDNLEANSNGIDKFFPHGPLQRKW